MEEGLEMTIQVEISPETEAWLAAQAASQHMDIPTYAASLLEQAKRPVASDPQSQITPSSRQRPNGQKSLAQQFAESPFRGLNLNFEADRDFGRDVSR
jgi:hypothetical protein